MEELEADSVELMRKRVYDMAGILGKTVKARGAGLGLGRWLGRGIAVPLLLPSLVHLCSHHCHSCRWPPTSPSLHPHSTPNCTLPRPHAQVYLNGTRLKVKTFQEYCELYLGPKDQGGPPRVYERISDRWEVCIATTEGQFNQVGVGGWVGAGARGLWLLLRGAAAARGCGGGLAAGRAAQGCRAVLSAQAPPSHPPAARAPPQVSFVNSICTNKGGTHVNYIADQAGACWGRRRRCAVLQPPSPRQPA